MFEDDDDMLPEFEVIHLFHNSVEAFVVFTLVYRVQLTEQLALNISIVHIKLFVLAYFGCHKSSLRVFVIDALDHHAKGARVDHFDNFISIPKLFSRLNHIKTFFICNRKLILPSHTANSVYPIMNSKLYLFEFCQLITKLFKRLLTTPPIEVAGSSLCI